MVIVMIIIDITVKVLLSLLAILLLILIIPFEYEFNGQFNEEVNYEANIMWMFKFIKARVFRVSGENKFALFIANKQAIIRSFNDKEEKSSQKIKKDKIEEKKKNKTKDKESFKEYFQKKFLNDIWKYFKDIIKIITPSNVKIYGEYGFQDPSITGMLCGFIPLIAPLIPNRDIRLEPVFDDEILDIDISISGRIILSIILVRTIRFLFTETIRKKIFKKRKKVETY